MQTFLEIAYQKTDYFLTPIIITSISAAVTSVKNPF